MSTVSITLAANALSLTMVSPAGPERLIRAGEIARVEPQAVVMKGGVQKTEYVSGALVDTPGWTYTDYKVVLAMTDGPPVVIELGSVTNQPTWANTTGGQTIAIDAIQAWLATYAQ